MDIFADRILPLFEKIGLSDAELERAIGIPPKTINQWKNHNIKSYTKYIAQISKYFGVDPDYLLGRSDDPSPKKESSPGIKTWTAEELDALSDKELTKLLSDAAVALERRSSKG